MAALAPADGRAEDVRTVVLRDSRAVSGELAERVDTVLAASLRLDAGLTETEIAPVPLAEIELAAGCEGQSQRCMERIGNTLGADVVIVRRLDGEQDPPMLTLVSHEVGSGEDPAVTQGLLQHDGDALEDDVRQAVRTLYSLPPPVASSVQGRELVPELGSAAEPARVSPTSRRLRIAGWNLAATGGVMLAASLFTGIASNRAEDDYRDAPLRTPREVDRALSELHRAETFARATNVLLGVGAGVAAVGATLLLYERLSRDEPFPGPETLRVGAAPLRGGGVLSISGGWGAR